MSPLLLALLASAAPRTFSPDLYDGLHSAVLAPGDVNGDGWIDVVAVQRSPALCFGDSGSTGRTLVALSGADGSVLWTHTEPTRLGHALAPMGDLDEDGVADLAATCGDQELVVLLLSGATGSTLRVLRSPWSGLGFGRAIAGGADATGDRVPDLLIGAEGGALLIDGKTTEIVATITRTPSDGEEIPLPARRPARLAADGSLPFLGFAARSALGASVAFAPDLDGDGLAEIAIGEECFFSEDCSSYVVASLDPKSSVRLASPGWCMQSLGDVDEDGHPEWASTADSYHVRLFRLTDGRAIWEADYDGYKMNGEGSSLAVLPDLDGDGAPELAVGANETGDGCDQGFVAIYSVRTGDILRTFVPEPLDDDLQPTSWDETCPSGIDVAWLPGRDAAGPVELVLHVARLNEVRVVSAEDGTVRWRAKL